MLKGDNKQQKALISDQQKKIEAARLIREEKARRALERKNWMEDEF